MALATAAHDIFPLPVSVGEKVLRAVLVYAFLVAVLRLVGRREPGQQNTLDLVVLLLIANAVQNAVIGADNSFSGAIVSVLVLVALNEAVNRASAYSDRVARIVEGSVSMFARDEPRAYHPTADALSPVPGQGESGAGE
ncbi:MAG TPA: hypothetical protein VFB26_05115 [Gaiellaceae bacterium]|nr:hypothetical protein [Gaiellaceae bacterium]